MKRVLTEGFLAGALGYLVVASFFAVANLAAGDSMFRTAYLLGEAVGAGTGGIGDAAGIVLAANGIHLVVSMLLGLCAAWVVMEVEHHHTFWYVAFIALFGGFVGTLLIGGIFGAEVTGAASWGRVTVASVLFALSLGAFFWLRHRDLAREISEELED